MSDETADAIWAKTRGGLDRPCPRCDSQPGESCVNQRTGEYRRTTHPERKTAA